MITCSLGKGLVFFFERSHLIEARYLTVILRHLRAGGGVEFFNPEKTESAHRSAFLNQTKTCVDVDRGISEVPSFSSAKRGKEDLM